MVAATPVPRARRLAAAAGSLGVSVSVVVALGKTPTEQQTIDFQAALSTPGDKLVALQANIVQAVATNARAPASAFAASAPTGARFVGSPFISQSSTAAAAAGSAAPVAGGAAAGGVIGAILLACAVWSYRSYAKHGQLPCCRDRKSEVLSRRNEAFEAAEVAQALAEAETALEVTGPAGVAAAPVFRPARPVGAKSAVVKRLVDVNAQLAAREAKAAAEVAELKRQLSVAKKADNADADEVAELRRQLAAARAAAAAKDDGALSTANPVARESFPAAGVP